MRDQSATIAVVAPQEPFELFDLFWEGVWSAAYEIAPLGVRVLTFSTTHLDTSEQARALRDLMEEQVSAIVLVPADSEKLNALIEQHALRGTPVLTAFNDAPASRRAAFIGSDFRQAGRMAGELMSRMLKPRSHIVALAHHGESQYLRQRYEGFRQALKESGNSYGITEFDDPQNFTIALSGHGRACDGLFLGCPEASNVNETLKNIRRPVCCVTFDLTASVRPFLANGAISAVIDSSRYHQGYVAIQKAYEAYHTSATGPAWIAVPSTIVLASNMNATGDALSLNGIFENLVHQRTRQLGLTRQELLATQTRLMRAAETDPLTETLNRRRFEETLEQELARPRDGSPVSLILVDVEGFRALNDHLGHAAGDQSLRALAEALRRETSAADSIGRVGADEFAILLPGLSRTSAERLKERLRHAIHQTAVPGHPDVRLDASIGLATLSSGVNRPVELFEAADQDLYQQKRATRASVLIPKTA